MYFNLRNIGFEKNLFTLVSDKGHKMWLVYIQITSPYPMADGHEVWMLLGFSSTILLQISKCDVSCKSHLEM